MQHIYIHSSHQHLVFSSQMLLSGDPVQVSKRTLPQRLHNRLAINVQFGSTPPTQGVSVGVSFFEGTPCLVVLTNPRQTTILGAPYLETHPCLYLGTRRKDSAARNQASSRKGHSRLRSFQYRIEGVSRMELTNMAPVQCQGIEHVMS